MSSFDIGRFDGSVPSKVLDPMDPMAPDAWQCEDPTVIRARVYKSHRIACHSPFTFWRCHGRDDGKPVSPVLAGSMWTSLDVICAEIDKALKAEAGT